MQEGFELNFIRMLSSEREAKIRWRFHLIVLKSFVCHNTCRYTVIPLPRTLPDRVLCCVVVNTSPALSRFSK